MSSVIKCFNSKFFGGHINIEMYNSAQDVVSDLEVRAKTDRRFDDPYDDREFVGANKNEAYVMLREGYQPIVEKLKEKVRFTAYGIQKRFKTFNDVQGFAPIIPNSIMGLPKSMVNSSIKPIKTKVIDVFYDMTVSCYIESDDLIEAGLKILGIIMELETQEYRFNLYCVQTYYDSNNGCDMLCVKVKSANQPMDLKRMSFPIAHTAFFRGIGFDWYSKFPKGTYRFGYGRAISYEKTLDEITKEFRLLYGNNAFYFSAKTIIEKDNDAEEYLKGVLTHGQVDTLP